MMNKTNKGAMGLFLVFFVTLGLSAAQPVEPCFEKLPPGFFLVESFVASQEQVAAIQDKLGVSISRVSNSKLFIHGARIQVNILHAESLAGADKLHKIVLKTKGHPAYCLKKGKQVIEYVGGRVSVALAIKTTYELGFQKKPESVRYRVSARLVPVDKAVYMKLNLFFNIFQATDLKAPGQADVDRIKSFAEGFEFGNTLMLRRQDPEKPGSAYQFQPAAVKQQVAVNGELMTVQFGTLPRVVGVPHVAMTVEVAADATGLTATKRKPEKALLTATPFWPSDDPDIIALSKKIIGDKRTTEDKVQAILSWLRPGTHIKFAGWTGSRWGTKQVLSQKYGQCWDFSDVCVSLCRAAGIPARQVAGWFYGASGHVWAEVLIPGKGWLQVDPTGGGILKCGIYHIPYFTTENGEMPILYLSMPDIEIVEAK